MMALLGVTVTTPSMAVTALTIPGPAIVATRATTYLVEPGWQYYAAAQGAVWFSRVAP